MGTETFKFKGFVGIIEIKHSLPGRLRYYIPCLINNIEHCSYLFEQLQKISIISRAEINPVNGSVLLLFDEGKIDIPTMTGVLIRLLELENQIEHNQKSMAAKSLGDFFNSINVGIRENTKGVFDLNSLLSITFLAAGIHTLVTKPFVMPPAISLLYWAYRSATK